MQISLWAAKLVLAIGFGIWYNYFCGCVAITMHHNTNGIGVDVEGCVACYGNFDGVCPTISRAEKIYRKRDVYCRFCC